MTIRAILTNLGSLGDVQPLMALALELRRSGHDPVLALAPQYAQYADELDFEFISIGPKIDFRRIQEGDTAHELQGGEPLQRLQGTLEILDSMLPQMFSELSSACWRADLLISGPLQPASKMVHETTGILFVSIQTSHFGNLQGRVFREAACEVINPFRVGRGLPRIVDPLHMDANSRQLALYAISRYLRPPAADWPSHYHVTGFFFLKEDGRPPDPDLAAFLAEGPAPVVFTFSSIAHDAPQAMTQLIFKVIEELDCRAVVLSGWSGFGESIKKHPSIYTSRFVQHGRLFPQAACIVHAGGAGTTGMALKSGVPSVVVPHVGDQPIWAELVRGIGCSKYTIPYRELSAHRLRDAIAATLSDPGLSQRATQMAEKIRNEQGVVAARRLIEKLFCKDALIPEQMTMLR